MNKEKIKQKLGDKIEVISKELNSIISEFNLKEIQVSSKGTMDVSKNTTKFLGIDADNRSLTQFIWGRPSNKKYW